MWILQELAREPAYGYALLQRVRVRMGVALPVGPSALYPSLFRLRAAGLVRVFHGRVSRGPLRKYYELTEEGRLLLSAIGQRGVGTAKGQAARPFRFGPWKRGIG